MVLLWLAVVHHRPPSSFRRASPAVPHIALAPRPVYPYSVIPGGAYDARELEMKLASDNVAAKHYQGFSPTHVFTLKSPYERQVYMSYRKGSAIYWTTKAVLLHAGETLLSDGTHYARARCGNRISESPQQPVEKPPAKAPSELLLDLPESWEFPLLSGVPGRVESPSVRGPQPAAAKTALAPGSRPGQAAATLAPGTGTGPVYPPVPLEPGAGRATQFPPGSPVPGVSGDQGPPVRQGVPRPYSPIFVRPSGSSPGGGGRTSDGSSPGSGGNTEPGGSTPENQGNTGPPIVPPAGGGSPPTFGPSPEAPAPDQAGDGPGVLVPVPIAIVPEPASLLLLGTALAALGALRYRLR
jgi:PEP-CTERM motif-containing protein